MKCSEEEDLEEKLEQMVIELRKKRIQADTLEKNLQDTL